MTPHELSLLPTGTARARLGQVFPAHAVTRKESDWPRDLALAAANALEGGEESFFLSWELARCGPELDQARRRAVALLAFSVLANGRAGSTRLPVSGPEVTRGLDRHLGRIGVNPSDRQAISRVLAAAREGNGTPESRLIGRSGEFTPLVLEGDWLSTQRLRRWEGQLVTSLGARLAAPLFGVELEHAGRALDSVVSSPPILAARAVTLTGEQRLAVLGAAFQPLTVVSGGPGTGKTSIVVSILRLLVRLGIEPQSIGLAAPTGKAAKRMEDSIRRYLAAVPDRSTLDDELLAHCPKPETLHRLLKYSPTADRFAHHENNRLAQKVVIIDESSMIDLFLMDRLVRSTAADARLVLLGDADQLPSVDAGAVFRDLVPPGPPAPQPWHALVTLEPTALLPAPSDDVRARSAVRLTTSFRMDKSDPLGSRILTVANAVRDGLADAFLPGGAAQLDARAHAGEIRYEAVELLEPPAGSLAPEALHRRWWNERLRGLPDFDALISRAWSLDRQGALTGDLTDLQKLFAHFDKQRILCLTRSPSQPWGTEAVNDWFHAEALDHLRREEGGWHGTPDFLPGEPVMVEQNDYERDLFNGDQGLVLRLREEGAQNPQLMAVFPRGAGFAAHHLDVLRRHLTRAYALTVHKAQGSEFDAVTLLLPAQESPILTREILYTALTRSRKSVVIVGQRQLLARAVRNSLDRHSGVAEGLAGAAPPHASSAA